MPAGTNPHLGIGIKSNGPAMSEVEQKSEETIFSTALRRAPSERAAYLDEACGGDPALRQRIEDLLKAQPQLGTFMEDPPDGIAGESKEGLWLGLVPEEGPGTRIGRYKLLQKLGEGGCGVVYMAEQDEPVRRRVALKVIKLGMDTKSVIARFEAERQALALMDHPNIAKVLDGGATETGRPYFVMELVRGIKITEFCDQNRLSTRERLDLFIQVCQAVQHAHQKGIIHRDLKPSNILVTIHDPGAPGVPVVIDFGIAKATQGRLTDQTLFTAFEQFLGTPAYMSPEQTLMTVQDVDTRSDIYSLGVLLYELLMGHTPFEGKELMAAGLEELRRTIREKEPVRPSTRLSTLMAAEQTTAARYRQTDPPKLLHLIRGDLDWIVMKCLEKDRARRYETANALAMDLQRHLKNEPVLARPPSRLYEFQKTVRRHKFGFAAAGLVMAALVAGMAASLWQAARANHAEREQRHTAQEAQYRAYVSDMNRAHSSLLEGDLGGARALLRAQIPKPGSPDLRNWEWRYLADQCRGDELRALAGHRSWVNNVRFIDDQTLLTTCFEELRTVLWRPESGQAVLTLTNPAPGIGPLVRASKTHRLFYIPGWGGSRAVRTLDLATGSDSEFCTNAAAVTALGLSPSQDLLAVASGTRVDLWRLQYGRTLPNPIFTPGVINAVVFSPDSRHLAVAGGDPAGTFIFRDLTSNTSVTNLNASGWICLFSPDGRFLVCGLGFGPLKLRRVEDRSEVQALSNFAQRGNAAFSPDGKWLATVGDDEAVRLWDTATWQIRFWLKGHTDPVVGVDFSPNSRLLATTAGNGEVKVWAVGEPRRRSDSVGFAESSVGVVRDGSAFWRVPKSDVKNAEHIPGEGPVGIRVLAGEVWSATSMQPLGTVRFEDLVIHPDCHDLSPGGLTLAVGCLDNTIHLRSVNNTNDLAKGDAGRSGVPSVQISMDGSVLVSLCRSGESTIRAWRLPAMTLMAEREDIPHVQQTCLSDDGTSVAVFTDGGEIGVLNLPSLSGPPLWQAVEGRSNWKACAIAPNRGRLAAALASGDAYIWDLSTRARLSLPRTLTWYNSLAFSRDGSRLVANDDRAIRLFDTSTGQQVLALDEPVFQIALTRDGQDLLGVGAKRAFMLHAPPLDHLQFDWLTAPSSTWASQMSLSSALDGPTRTNPPLRPP